MISHNTTHFIASGCFTLQWRHNERDGVSNHLRLKLFAQSFVQVQIKKNIKAPRHWSLWRESTGDIPSQRANNAEIVSMWWRHHEKGPYVPGMPGTFPRHRLQRKPLVSDPGMHHGKCVTHVPWCMSVSLTHGGGENVPGILGACATRDYTYLARGPWAFCSNNGQGVLPWTSFLSYLRIKPRIICRSVSC